MAEEQPIRFGILGCASIARKVSRAICLSKNCTIVAIGSRSIDKAVSFSKENNLPDSVKTYGTYNGVLEDNEVDAVYIPLPTSLHLRWAVSAAEKKKHILLEKPVALNVKELDEILKACESNGVQFMDSTMWMHHPRTAQMKRFLSDPHLFGLLKSVHSVFTYNPGPVFLENNIRVKPDLDSLGALGDVGWYCIRAILWTNDYRLPKTVTALGDSKFNDAGVILSCGASLQYEDGTLATFNCSFLTKTSMHINAVGANGILRVHDFVIPFKENVGPYYASTNTQSSAELSTGIEAAPGEYIVETDLPQEALMVSEFSNLVGRLKTRENSKPEEKWAVISRKTQVIVDAVKASIDKGYQAVEVVY